MMMKKIKSILLPIATTLLIWGCGQDTKKTEDMTKETTGVADGHIQITKAQFQENGMALGSFEEKSFPVTVNTNGMIDVPPENRATVSAVMGGYIKKTPLLVGNQVRKGELLVVLENPEFVSLQQEYLETKERLAYLESEYERHKILFKENISSQKNYLKTESEFKTANAKYNGLQKKLKMLNISPAKVEEGHITTSASLYAPIAGSITNVWVSKGTYVSPASPILEIVDNDHIHLELSVFEKDILNVEKGQPIFFKIPEASDTRFEAAVYLVGTAINENRTIKVHGHLKNEKETNFLTGMFVEAAIVTEETKASALPSEAIVTQDDKAYVLRFVSENATGYQLEQVSVQTGETYDGFTVITNTEKFDSGDQFLTKGAFGLVGEEGGGHEH